MSLDRSRAEIVAFVSDEAAAAELLHPNGVDGALTHAATVEPAPAGFRSSLRCALYLTRKTLMVSSH
jgi:hypothetical protein